MDLWIDCREAFLDFWNDYLDAVLFSGFIVSMFVIIDFGVEYIRAKMPPIWPRGNDGEKEKEPVKKIGDTLDDGGEFDLKLSCDEDDEYDALRELNKVYLEN
ncbi:uncharacterized protein LOC123300678 isoform X2 [Chrysoperla carnea]|uniref:uncharacterized protein LOC123300678 isoform X2 n=1 Tax=Chrysoperla carnea TaxID=189513 RepID=UPI001D077B93|nr:uncharacterized protein LOC123300678 isoform X2 [Chrysoperla carnea]